MCVLSPKLLFGGTDWIENWRRGDKHKLGFLPKKNRNITLLQNLPLTAMCGGITRGDDYNLRIINPLSAKYSFSLFRQFSNGLAVLVMVKEHVRQVSRLTCLWKLPIASGLGWGPRLRTSRIPEQPKHIQNDSAITDLLCLLFCFPIQMRWKVLSDEKFWKYILCYLYFPVDWLVACLGKQRFCGTFWWKSSLCFLRHIPTFRFPVFYRV